MTSLRHPILDIFLHGRAVPLIHLITQFLNPGMKDVDAKKAAPDEKNHSTTKPLLTRDEAYSRLRCRLLEGVSADDHASCKDYLQTLNNKRNFRCSSNEKFILGLAYKYGLGGIPKDAAKAKEQFKLASDKDDKNSYAHFFTVESLNSEELEHGSYLWLLHDSKDNGLTYAFRGIGSSKADEYCEKSAELQHYLGLHNLGCMYATHQDEAQRTKGASYLKTAAAQGCADSLAAYAHYYLEDPDLREKCIDTALQYESGYASLLFAHYHAHGEKISGEDLTCAAEYYRLASVFDKNRKIDAQEQLLQMIRDCDAILADDQYLHLSVLYHYTLINRDPKTLAQLLYINPQVFATVWTKDYKEPLHPKMKEQAIAFVLDLVPENVPIEANRIFANALADCSEEILKNKAKAFSLEYAKRLEQQKLRMTRDAKSAVALAEYVLQRAKNDTTTNTTGSNPSTNTAPENSSTTTVAACPPLTINIDATEKALPAVLKLAN